MVFWKIPPKVMREWVKVLVREGMDAEKADNLVCLIVTEPEMKGLPDDRILEDLRKVLDRYNFKLPNQERVKEEILEITKKMMLKPAPAIMERTVLRGGEQVEKDRMGILDEIKELGKELGLDIEESNVVKRGIGQGLLEVASLSERKGDFDKAIRLYEKAIAVFNEIGDKGGIAVAFLSLARIYFMKGDLYNSMKIAEKSLEISEEIGDKRGIAATLLRIGMIHDERGEYDEALEYYEKSLKIFEEIGDKERIAELSSKIRKIQEKRNRE